GRAITGHPAPRCPQGRRPQFPYNPAPYRLNANQPRGPRMRRREFIAGLGGAAAVPHVCWPLSAHAQQRALPAIGFLSPGAMSSASGLISAFRRGLGEVGYVEVKTVEIEFRYGAGKSGPLPARAAELIGRGFSVLIASGAAAVPAAKTAAGSTPVVFSAGIDPVATGV